MSGLVGGTLLSSLQDLVGSRARLRAASFRGVPFIVDESAGAGGRRLVTHEFPLRDDAYTEDLGKLPRRFRLRAFVIDANESSYLDLRDALIDACEGFSTAATLVHPTHGDIVCRAGVLNWQEHLTDSFGWCDFNLEFVQDGPQPSPLSADDTASALLAGIASLLPVINTAYEATVLALVSPAALLDQVVTSILGLPGGTILGLGSAIAAISATPTNFSATATAAQSAVQSMAANVIAAQPSAPATDDPVLGQPFAFAPPADTTGGLAGLATWGASLPPIAGTTPQAAALAAQQQAVVALVQGNATAAVAQLYASITWPDADAATAARTQLLGLLDAQTAAAASAGQDALYLAWQGLTALAMTDMITRAQALPVIAPYTLPAPLPSLALAQMLYQDATRAAQLENLNDVPHPLFMPASGLALSS
jgi:prophage DNA circulation protein